MLQLRADLPEEFGSDDLTTEGTVTMIMLRALLSRYGMENFQVVRLDSQDSV